MRLILPPFAVVVALAACAERTPGPASEPASPAPADACGAAARQAWIGRARAGLPAAPPGTLWRIFETGQPVTHDLRPERLNIEIDPESQTVVRLSCG